MSGSGGGFPDNSICVGYRHQFDLINERNGETHKLFSVPDGCKAHLIAAMDLYEDEEPELLLCFNSKYLMRCRINPMDRLPRGVDRDKQKKVPPSSLIILSLLSWG